MESEWSYEKESPVISQSCRLLCPRGTSRVLHRPPPQFPATPLTRVHKIIPLSLLMHFSPPAQAVSWGSVSQVSLRTKRTVSRNKSHGAAPQVSLAAAPVGPRPPLPAGGSAASPERAASPAPYRAPPCQGVSEWRRASSGVNRGNWNTHPHLPGLRRR